MDKAIFKELIKNYLRINIIHDNNRVKVCLMFEDDCIDYDFIDYSEVVRVVERLNQGEYQ